MPTVTPILRTQKRDKRGRSPIWLRISDRDGSQYLSLGEKVLPSQWNPRQGRVRKGHPNADLLNALIASRLEEAEAELLKKKIKREDVTSADLKGLLREEKGADFFAFAERYLKRLRRSGSASRYNKLSGVVSKLQAYVGGDLPFERITPRFLRDYEAYSVGTLGNKQSTTAKNLAEIRALFNKAIEEGLVRPEESPFLRLRLDHGSKPDRLKLTPAEILALGSVEVDDDSPLRHVRDGFMFAFYCGGIRFSDLALLKQRQIVCGDDGLPKRLAYSARKTQKSRSVILTQPARQILEGYFDPERGPDAFVFPFLVGYDVSTPDKELRARSSQNALCNKHLRRLSELAGIGKPVSTHIARHSFADYARSEGWSVYDISKALQHSSLEMTERYLKAFDEDALDANMTELFD